VLFLTDEKEVWVLSEKIIFTMRATRLGMAANANKTTAIALLFAAVSVSGCGPKDAPLKLGNNFPVCINAQERIVVRGSSDGHDFDVVHLAVDGVLVDAVVGWHPPFSNDRIKNGIGAKNAFVYLGKERSGDKDRILWGYDRGEVSGPVFVVFSGHDLASIEPVLTAEKLLVSCNVEAWEKARSRDVRPTSS
jgi:hypothetical protein